MDTAKTTADDTTKRIRDLNEQILSAAKKAGNAYLDTYEKTLASIAAYQEQTASETDVDWVATMLESQARFARDLTKVYVSTVRESLK